MSEPTPIRTTPITEPSTEPVRRMYPSRICPGQRRDLGDKIRRTLEP